MHIVNAEFSSIKTVLNALVATDVPLSVLVYSIGRATTTATGKNSKKYQNISKWKAYARQRNGFFKIADLRSVSLRFTIGVNPFHSKRILLQLLFF